MGVAQSTAFVCVCLSYVLVFLSMVLRENQPCDCFLIVRVNGFMTLRRQTGKVAFI